MSLNHVVIGTGSGGVGTSTVDLAVTFNISTPGDALEFQLYNANSPCAPQLLNLTSGNNTISTTVCPALATAGGVWLIPPLGNGQALTIKGINADTGLPISTTAPTFIALPVSPPSSFVINAAGAVTAFQLLFV